MFTRIAVAVACLAAATASAAQKEFHASRAETITAKVKKVDQQSRMVTLVGEDGAETSFKASDEVKNLAQVKAGDTVTASMDQSLTLWLLAADEPGPPSGVGADAVRAAPGQKPGGIMTADVSGVATVESIAADKKSVTLKGPRGNLLELDVRDPTNLDGVAVGSRVGFMYSETLAVAVTPAPAKPAKKKK